VVLIPEAAAVLNADLETGSLHEALRAINLSPHIASSWITARVANSKEAKELKLPANIPLLVEKRVIDDEKGNPIEFTETAYAANRYVVDMRLGLLSTAAEPFKAAPMAPAKTPN
jgi:GntR family transcriptional regulator